MMRAAPNALLMKLLDHRQGSVALMTGIMAPVLVMTLAMGVEVTSWSVTNLDLQRIADVSAWAGAAQYASTQNAQSATQTAADVAEINGAAGTSTRSWSAANSTTTDNLITAQLVAGVRNAGDNAIKVVVKRTIAKSFSRIFPSAASSVTVSATATAEIIPLLAGPQPCLFALKGDGNGVITGSDITLNGSADIKASNCSVRSDAGITLNGSSKLEVGGTYAGGAIAINGSASITGGTYANSAQIADPYAGYAPLQSAFSALSSGGISGTVNGSTITTLNPGTYSSFDIKDSAIVTLNPATYTVNGPVTFEGSARVTGNGVTIISSGALSNNGSASVSLTAPLVNAAKGVPGVLFASQSSAASSFSGSSSLPFGGLIYYPNGNLSFNGSSSAGSTACTEVIAGVITISGSSNLSANNCVASYGTLPFGSLPSTMSIVLVR